MFAFNFPALRRRDFLVVVCLCFNLASFAVLANESDSIAIPGHVLPALDQAQPATLEKRTSNAQPMLLTIVLKREDIKGFSGYMEAVYNPSSAIYLDFLNPLEVSERFGPSQQSYDDVLAWFENQGLDSVETTENRITMTVSGDRADVESALGVTINDYTWGERQFFANANEPVLPKELANSIHAIIGLNSMARPQPNNDIWKNIMFFWQKLVDIKDFFNNFNTDKVNTVKQVGKAADAAGQQNKSLFKFTSEGISVEKGVKEILPWTDLGGAGQKIGISAFDTFDFSDIENYIELFGLPSGTINNLSVVHVNGGAVPGPAEFEVLLDITTVMVLAPEAEIVVYDGPMSGAGTSFQALFNAMVNGGVDIISNSWAYCENQTTLSDVQSIETIFQTASASGISIFNASGDSGSTCLNGSPGVISVPANAPSGTAVGGTSLTFGPGYTYGSETWWNGEDSNPKTGQGGFGLSQFFTRPDYQNGLNAFAMRSIPDVAVNADPTIGIVICDDDSGGCPTGLFYGGTSVSAPIWASFAALLNEAQAQNLGSFNNLLYPLAGSNAFHDAASMGSDFAHVGLGSPNLNAIHLLLNNEVPGIPNAGMSTVNSYLLVNSDILSPPSTSVPADGETLAYITIILRDANGNSVPGITVSLTADNGSSVITPVATITSVDNGSALFTVTNLIPESVSYTVTDVTNGIELNQKAEIDFSVPIASSAGISASPTAVTANGVSTTTITVTLKDMLGRPTPGKLVTLEQNPGSRSLISGLVPGTTDNNGEAVFTATNLHNETVTYTAVDVSDGFLPVPGSVDVNFFNSDGASCAGEPLSATPGYAVEPFAVSFVTAQDFFFGGINFFGCSGVNGMAFDNAGNLFAADLITGDIYKFDVNGGTADAGTLVSSVLGPGVTGLAFGLDGKLYASRAGNPNTDVVEVDPVSGALVRVVGNVTLCAFGLATDPLSGDLFVSDFCFSGGSTAIHRIADPGGAAPVTTLYVNTPTDTNGQIAIAPDGMLYLRSGANIVSVTGTDQPMPPTVNVLPLDNPIPFGNLGLAIGATALDGSALSLLANVAPDPEYGDNPLGMTAAFNLAETPLPVTAQLLNGQAIGNVIGPDGCLYAALFDTVYKITNDDGSCGPLAARSAEPTLSLTPTLVNPNPVQSSEIALTVQVFNITVPENTPVFFNVEGANALTKLGHTDANGIATVTYQGTFSGADVVTAFATIDDNLVISNPARISWQDGQHQSFLSFNSGPTSGTRGTPVALQASLTDVSTDPQTAIVGQPIEFSVGGQSCTGNTDADGIASCTLILLNSGTFTLNAEFAGGGQFIGSVSEQSFFVLDSPFVPPPPDNQVRQIPVFSLPGLFLLNVIVGLLAVMGYRRRVR